MPEEVPADKGGLTSVRNALSVLNMLSDGVELRVVDVASSLNVAASTAHRLMTTLVEEGFLRQAAESRKYVVGPSAVRMARVISYEQTLKGLAEPYLKSLCRELDETINLQILDDFDVYFLASAEDRHQLRVAQRAGVRQAASTTAGGKVLLALSADAPRSSTATHEVWSDDFIAELEEIRARGYALNFSDVENSVRAVAVPVHRPHGDCLAALSLAAPTPRLPDSRLRYVLPALQRAADTIGHTYAGKAKRTPAR